MRRLGLRGVAIAYLLAILVGPLLVVFYRTFENGFDPAWNALSAPDTIHAFKLTLIITVIAVPVNTVFGVVCALAIVRRQFPGKGVLNAFISQVLTAQSGKKIDAGYAGLLAGWAADLIAHLP